MPKQRRDIPAQPPRSINTNVLLAEERNALWGFGVVHCSFCHGTGVTPFRHHFRLCDCVLRGIARYVLGMVNRIRHGAASLSLWSPSAPRSYYLLCNYCADVDIMIRDHIPPAKAETLWTMYPKSIPHRSTLYAHRYQALTALGAESLRRGLYPPSNYFYRGPIPCPYLPPRKSIRKSMPPSPVPPSRTPSPA